MPKNLFDPKKAQKILHERFNIEFVKTFIEEGAKVYLFGGSLRDMVMGKDWKDPDMRVWINLPPKERDVKTEELLKKTGISIKSKTPFGDAFTVFRFIPSGSKENIDIDLSVESNQWQVSPDFTINGLYFDLETSKLIDRFNAVKDINKKIIRTAKDPDIQFKEEPYMIFRAVKVACQFGFEVEPKTMATMKKYVELAIPTLKSIADKEMPAFTEWFLGNMFRGLKYDPARFQKIWNETGLSKIFLQFTADRLGKKVTSTEIFIFKNKNLDYETSLSMFLSESARIIDPKDPEGTFDKIISLYHITEPKQYSDFVLDEKAIEFKA